jgi:hypothetical protein
MVSKVRDPKPVWRRLIGKGRAQGLSANRPLNPIRMHQARNGTARDTETFST